MTPKPTDWRDSEGRTRSVRQRQERAGRFARLVSDIRARPSILLRAVLAISLVAVLVPALALRF